ncbi:unnamed protein product [Mytilus coruscus]|uniref:Uncharacterized protein n=1 Tax=Mytilus coruscus TaxID=42192 RepID=A0A6J8D8G9_MYTCO|nr:unnamed protein product [Mytilus coruscus]
MDLVRKSVRHYNSDSKILIRSEYENNYTLNLKKSLKNKLESTKRSEIEYVRTRGGVTVKLDAISFELFIYACEQLYVDSNNYDLTKTTGTDKLSNNVQYSFEIMKKGTEPVTYIINAYLTKCSLLINGRNVQSFMDNDGKQLHIIMSNTTIQGAKINVGFLNQNLASKLETALESIDNPRDTVESKTTETALKKATEKCYKCNRTCKS